LTFFQWPVSIAHLQTCCSWWLEISINYGWNGCTLHQSTTHSSSLRSLYCRSTSNFTCFKKKMVNTFLSFANIMSCLRSAMFLKFYFIFCIYIYIFLQRSYYVICFSLTILLSSLATSEASTCACEAVAISSGGYGCKISTAAPNNHACKCSLSESSCSGSVTLCTNSKAAKCYSPDTTSDSCALAKGGNCKGY